ncbi:MAG: Gfo/Idh/MocA family oxidoreductase [Candidatus Omnitrophica bacterium]|nr:Gfo/Idh/MocA family oxidoreductase [Candidatus Omnitrophota bacterium]
MVKTPTLRVGIIGHGFMGKMHAHAYRSLNFYYDPAPARIVLAGVAARTKTSVKRAVQTWGYEFGTTDYRELCERRDIDVINCCTPNNLHKDVLLAALENGKHVYMDKPLCCTLDEAAAMKEAAEAHPECVAQMTFQYRFAPALLRAKELIDSGALGHLYSARVAYLHAGYINPARPFTWRLDKNISGRGGALFDLGAHVIDLTRHLLGDFSEVMHLGETMIKERPLPGNPDVMAPVEVDDVSILLFRLKNGAVGTLESSRLATGAQDEVRFEAHGSQGAIRFNLMQPNYLEYYDASTPESVYGGDRGYKHIECVARYPRPASLPGPKNTIGWERFHVHSIYHFVTHVLQKKPARPGIEDGYEVQRILESALQSTQSSAWVSLES